MPRDRIEQELAVDHAPVDLADTETAFGGLFVGFVTVRVKGQLPVADHGAELGPATAASRLDQVVLGLDEGGVGALVVHCPQRLHMTTRQHPGVEGVGELGEVVQPQAQVAVRGDHLRIR